MNARNELYAFGMLGKEHSPVNSNRMSQKIDAYRAQVLTEAIPAWEAAYDSATFTPYLIGYCNDEVAAKAAALAWYQSQAETDDALSWEPDPQMAVREWDQWFSLCRTSADTGTELATDIVVRHRAVKAAESTPVGGQR